MKLMSKTDILSVSDLPCIDIEVPEWGEDVAVRIKKLSLAQFATFLNEKFDGADYFYRLIAYSLVDEEGKRLFTDAEAKKLGEKSTEAMTRIFEQIKALNGLDSTVSDREQAMQTDFLSDSSMN